jgi:uncharacterized protein YjlB
VATAIALMTLRFADDGAIPNSAKLLLMSKAISHVPLPDTDPVHGRAGPLVILWQG